MNIIVTLSAKILKTTFFFMLRHSTSSIELRQYACAPELGTGSTQGISSKNIIILQGARGANLIFPNTRQILERLNKTYLGSGKPYTKTLFA